jgi:hypothetical protein
MSTAIDWSNPVPENKFGPREESPRTLRFPKDLAARIAQLAEARGQDFTTTALYLLTAAIEQVEAAQPKAKKR